MKEQEIKRLIKLHKDYIKSKSKHDTSLGILITNLAEVTGKEIQYNEFVDDGLGICVGGHNAESYMDFTSALTLICKKGTIDEDDFTFM